MTEWFKHDFKARTHPRLQRIQMKFGMEGIGIYWSLIEMLYEQGGSLMLSECESYAFALRVDGKRLADFVNESGAFVIDGDSFYSDTVRDRMEERMNKSEKASQSAKKRWNNANTMRTHSEGNAIREEKNREEKRREEKKEVVRFVPPTVDEVFELMRDRKQSEMFVAHYESKGWKVGRETMKDWRASVRGWLIRNNMTPEPMSTRDQFANYGDSI